VTDERAVADLGSSGFRRAVGKGARGRLEWSVDEQSSVRIGVRTSRGREQALKAAAYGRRVSSSSNGRQYHELTPLLQPRTGALANISRLQGDVAVKDAGRPSAEDAEQRLKESMS
jgi:hypothetical protein